MVFKHQDIVTGSYQMTKADGTPLTRNVFAGKAVIAELSGTGTESCDMVTWKTSDPGSGTVVAEVKSSLPLPSSVQ